MIKIYTDGSCIGNPGNGGWAAIIIKDEKKTQIKGSKKNTTNNQMELMAAIKALESLKETCQVDLFTDSKYVKLGITEWIMRWKTNGFKNAKKKPVVNAQLWIRLDAVASEHQINWQWVKGHAGHVDNERADALANQGLELKLSEL